VDGQARNDEPLDRKRINPMTGDPHAVLAARRDAGNDEWPDFDTPATVAKIQSACCSRSNGCVSTGEGTDVGTFRSSGSTRMSANDEALGRKNAG